MTNNKLERVEPDWLNAEVCIENAQIAYDDSLCDEDGPVDTVISSGDLGVIIGLAEHALRTRAACEAEAGEPTEAMIEAARQASDWVADLRDHEIAHIYHAMRRAATAGEGEVG